MSDKESRLYGVLTYLTDVLCEPGRARLIWAAKTADATATHLGAERVVIISSRGFFSGIRVGGRLLSAGSVYRKFYQITHSLRVCYVPCLGLRMKFLKQVFAFERQVGLFFLKHYVLPRLSVLHTRDYDAAEIALSRGVHVVYEDHDEDFHRSVNFSPEFLSSNLLIEVIAITESVKQRLVQSGVPSQKVCVRGSGVSERQIVRNVRPIRASGESEPKTAVYCGGLHENRGIDYILELAHDFPEDKFIIVGGRNAHVKSWKTKYQGTNVIFEGYLDQEAADAIQEAADFLLLPYKDPNLAKITSPLKFYSYMAKARPVVCSIMPEISEHQGKPLAVEWCGVGDCESFIEAYERARGQSWSTEQLEANASLASQYTWEVRQRSLIDSRGIRDLVQIERPEAGETGLDHEAKLDWVFAMNHSAKGWVLETICRHVAVSVEGESRFVYTKSNGKFTEGLPRAKRYWFAHFNQLVAAIRTKKFIRDSEMYVWFTHFKDTGIPDDELVAALNSCRLVFCTCSEVINGLLEMGVRKNLLRCYIGGADAENFQVSARLGKTVGISAGYYPRKNPVLLLEVMMAMPDTSFILLAPAPEEINNPGILWSSWERFSEMDALANFEIRETRYVNYPTVYAEMDVFLSASLKEGGPIPLLEAMMSNVYPVVSLAGFAPDVIKSSDHGLVFDVSHGGDVAEVVRLLRMGLANRTDVREYALQFSWDSFAKKIMKDVSSS